MKISIDYEGKTYKSRSVDDVSVELVFNSMYEHFEDFTKLTIETEDGSRIIFGRDAVQKCVITISE